MEIRTRRTASYCENSAYVTVSWSVEATPIAGSLAKTPDVMNVCENDIVSAILTAGNGGNGIDELDFRTNNGTWSAWTAYTSGTDISTADLSGVEIRTRRTAAYCENSAYVTVSWNVEATPIAGSITKTPDVMNVCENDIVSAILTAGNGGNGIDEFEFRTNDGIWTAWAAYTSGADISTSDLSGVEIRTRRTASYCENSAYVTVSWSVEATPIAGSLAKTPDVMNVCENESVSAILTAGNGGNGIDELEFRTNNGTWSAWTAYTSGTDISTADISGVEIRTRRTAAYCENSAYVSVSWTVEATPIAGALVKTPDVMYDCENDFVSAILSAGNGGNGIDELEFRTNNGTWSAWSVYTSGTDISTAGLSGVEIRTRRTASYCENSAYVTVSWNVEATAIAGALTKTPDVMNVCENDIVSAILTAGNGGNGIDELEFRTNNGTWSAWTAYTSGADIPTADLSGVEIRTRRNASYCENSAYVSVSWTMEATPIAGSLAKTPDVVNVCENEIVSALFTSGNGGNGIDELEFRTNNVTWTAWTAYISGTEISTTDLSGVEIRTRRTASYCENSAYVTVSWSVEATPIAGTLAKTPDVMNVCENDIVSAILTSGNGGNGIDELEFRTNNGTWSAWSAYTSGTDISTAGLSDVEIRTRRTASYCESTAYASVSWILEASPVSGILLKSPDVDHVCKGELVSATLIAGSGGNETDFLEYRMHNGSSWSDWLAYVSGTTINTSTLTSVEIRTWHTATYCENSVINVASWDMDDITLAGIVTGPQGVCYGENSTTLIATGYTGNIVMWQSSTDYWVTLTNIPNTEPELFVEDLTVTTQFRTVVQSGTCNQIYSLAAEIGVDPLPVPFINGPETICGSNSLNEYTTEPGMIDYQWVVSSGEIVEGQGTNQVMVMWDEAGVQVVSVDYQTVFGCTMPEPFQLFVNVVTPETPQISIDELTLTSSATNGNQWYLNGQPIEGASGQSYEVTQNGDYTCIVTVDDCSSDVSNVITVQTVGVEVNPLACISIFPIPSNGEFTLSVVAPAGTRYTASVINNLGKIVYQTESFAVSGKYTRSFSLGHLTDGIYTVIVKNEKSQYVKKIVINHE
ncbi:MAG: T9SS type A sorting domain-containing protein [Bacteroidales bacterium]|nr:T9SS type A sorting domain-containing protein [Bacteroidales bacterium]